MALTYHIPNTKTQAAMAETLVYRDHESHTCIAAMSKLFEGLGPGESVQATVTRDPRREAYESITEVHNNLSSCRTWSKVQGWDEEVEYTINHPSGDVYAYDTKSTGTRLRTIDHKQGSFRAQCVDESASAVIRRVTEQPIEYIDFSTTRFSWVKVMNVKRFFYESARSSFVYRLVVQWEGATKEVAKENGMQFKIYLETNDHSKMSGVPPQSVVSFMEKTLDLLSDGRRHIVNVSDWVDASV